MGFGQKRVNFVHRVCKHQKQKKVFDEFDSSGHSLLVVIVGVFCRRFSGSEIRNLLIKTSIPVESENTFNMSQAIQAQLEVKSKCEQAQQSIKGLYDWEQEMKQKEAQSRQQVKEVSFIWKNLIGCQHLLCYCLLLGNVGEGVISTYIIISFFF